jgi:arylsulfatase
MPPPPNIILITVDEQRWDVLGCYGHKKVKTPNLDALAARGTRFARAYTQNPVCIPARACLQTGRYTHQHGVTYMEDEVDRTPGLPPWERTAAFGKIHMMPPKGYHYTQLCGGKGARWTQAQGSPLGPAPLGPVYARWLEARHPGGYELIYEQRRQPEYKQDMTAITNVLPLEEYVDTWIAENTCEFVRRTHESPFFIWCGICSPHGPFDPPEPYATMYNPDEVDISPTYLADDSDKPSHLRNKGGRFAKEPDQRLIRKVVAYYWGLCSLVDEMVGRVLRALDEQKLRQDTLVIYTSDHGDHMGDFSRLGKGTFWEGSARVPLIMAPPGRRASVPVVEDVVETFQIAPTILEYAGVPIPEEMQATSLRPVIEGKAKAPGIALSEYENNHRDVRGKAIITNRYKYAYWGQKLGSEFYDLQADPHETRNLVRNPQFADLVEEHKELLLQRLLESDRPIRHW